MTSVLDEVLGRINILDIVSQYVKLRRSGRDFVGLCPFHKEKTPSFTVSIEKQIYYCFGCHEGGNAVNFLAKYERSSFHEALETLAHQLGIESRGQVGPRRTPVFDALGKLAGHYHECLLQNKAALKYLADRQIEGEALTLFKLGYSERRTYTGKEISARLGAPVDLLLHTGIMKTRDSGELYDIFRGRIVVPICDVRGRVVGFGGRALAKDVLPKYINSPESAVFTKRSVLYGLDAARREITERDEVIMVEGYFDLITLHSAGVKNAVATLGTSVTEEQLSRLRNYTENMTLMLDGDEAGIKSALRLIAPLAEMGINGKMVLLPEGHDPDSFVRAFGPDGFQKVMAEKKELLDYLFDREVKRHGVSTLEGRMKFIRSVVPYVEGMRDAVKKRLYVQRLAELTGVEEYRFWDSMGNVRREAASERDGSRNVIEERVLGIVMNRPELLEKLKGKGVESQIGDRDLGEVLSRLINYYEQHARLDIRLFLNVLEREELREKAVRSALDVAECDWQEGERIVTDYLCHMESKLLKQEHIGITARLAEAEKRGDQGALQELLEKKRNVLAAMKNKSAK
ncbi:MAG: DNA primase [Syntrophorhabdales bacterium]|jgi:DNA primase